MQNKEEVFVIKVAGKSSVPKVAGSLIKAITENPRRVIELQAIGAGAVNQAVKAMTTARGTLASKGKDLYFIPGFSDTIINGESRTVLKFLVKY